MKRKKGARLTKLKKLRGKSGLTLDELAQKAGVDDKTISQIENAHTKRPFPSTLSKLADALNAAFKEKGLSLEIDIEDLLEDEPDEETDKPIKKIKIAGNDAQLALL